MRRAAQLPHSMAPAPPGGLQHDTPAGAPVGAPGPTAAAYGALVAWAYTDSARQGTTPNRCWCHQGQQPTRPTDGHGQATKGASPPGDPFPGQRATAATGGGRDAKGGGGGGGVGCRKAPLLISNIVRYRTKWAEATLPLPSGGCAAAAVRLFFKLFLASLSPVSAPLAAPKRPSPLTLPHPRPA